MYCIKCGKKLATGAMYCQFCGEAVANDLDDVAKVADVANVANVADVANVANVAKVADVADAANVANVAGVADDKKEKGTTKSEAVSGYNKNKGKSLTLDSKLMVGTIIVAVIAVIVVIVIGTKNKSAGVNENIDDYTASASTSEPPELVAEEETKTDEMISSNKSNNQEEWGNSTVEYEEEYDNFEDFVEEAEAADQFVSDCSPSDYLKYGVNETTAITSSFAVKQGDWLYFMTNDRLFKQNKAGDLYLLNEGCKTFEKSRLNICGDYLYYASYENYSSSGFDSIVRVRTDGQEKSTIIDDVVRIDLSYGNTFVCDYDGQSIVYTSADYKSSSTLVPMYKKYSMDEGMVVNEYMPEDYDGAEIKNIFIVGARNNYLYAIEEYGGPGYKTQLAKINIDTFSAERVEIDAKVSDCYAINSNQLFVCGDGINMPIGMVDLDTMIVSEEIMKSSEIVLACYQEDNENMLIFKDMVCVDIDKLPETWGFDLNDDWAHQGEVIDGDLYYRIFKDNRVYKVGVETESFEVIYDPNTSKVISD